MITDTIRALVRPLITLAAFGVLVWLLWAGRFDEAQWFGSGVALPVILWWYADRTAQRRQ